MKASEGHSGVQSAGQEGWEQTACILCSLNCGIEVQLEGRHFKGIRGDKADPASEGYLCQKAARLEHYQNHEGRLQEPLKRNPDGSFSPISWDQAIAEIAQRFMAIRDEHGGHTIAYYGGGGQGNHMPGAYAGAFRAALQTPYIYNSLAQEKTGDFWVNGQLFGRQTCHITEDIEHADVVVLIGTNPWQSHGIPQARKVLRALSKDPARTLIVIDPRRTHTAKLADVHLQVKPGTDAFLLTAILATIVQEDLQNDAFLQAHTLGFEDLAAILQDIPIAQYAQRAGIELDAVQSVARTLANAERACTRHDLGLEHSLHSTLNCYLEKLLFLLTGHFGRKGTNNLHTQFVPLIGHSKEPDQGGHKTRVTEMKEISKLFPPNILPLEIDADHPDRIRAVFVDSSNPILTAADTQAYTKAFSKLDLLVVVDVALSETAALAHYVLPASSQYEKAEATFFTLSFPTNYFHLRAPILPPLGNTLTEAEIYFRLCCAMGAIPERFPDLEEAAKGHLQDPSQGTFPMLFYATLAEHPAWKPYAPLILYATLGKALPDGNAPAAAIWGAAHFYTQRYESQVRRTGLEGEGLMLAEALFQRILTSPTTVPISTHTYDEAWQLVKHPNQTIHLAIPTLLKEIEALRDEPEPNNTEYPFILAAGERRTYNANQIYRDPQWRRNDPEGALRIHPQDAQQLDIHDGTRLLCESPYGSISVQAQIDDSVLPGCLSLPHGYGQSARDPQNPQNIPPQGPRINDLTSSQHCDPLAKTPYHKYIPVRLSKN